MTIGVYRHWRYWGPKWRATYTSWYAARRRCMDPKEVNYAGRGISMCSRWANDFDAFVDDMGKRPTGMTLERRNNAGNYEPENCIWATPKAQAHNRRTNHNVTYAGQTLTISAWSEKLGVNKITLHSYIRRHSPERAIARYLARMEF